jgi:hypothetical protein
MRGEYKPKSEDVMRKLVITEHNTNKTPKNHFFTWKDSMGQMRETNMVEYFKLKYNITFREENQPMLVVNQRDGYIYLPTSLCHEASLPKDFTKDVRRVRNLQGCKIANPDDRFNRISGLINKLKDNDEFVKWNLKVQDNFTTIKGSVLYPPKIFQADGQDTDWLTYEKGNIKHSEPIKLLNKKWLLCYCNSDYDLTNSLFSLL